MAIPLAPPCTEAAIRAMPAAAPCGRRAEPWVLTATIVGSSMAFVDATAVNVALPVLQADLDATVAGVQWVVESYALLLAALLLAGGSLGDRHGRRRTFAAGVGVFAAASAWCALSPTIGHLIAARAVQGAGAAILVPTSLALIGVSFPPERRGRAIGTWSAFSALTMAAGPVLGGWLIQQVSWRAVFFINLPLAAAVIGVLYARVPESRREHGNAPMDWPGAVLASLGLGGLTFAAIESSAYGLGHPVVLGTLAAGIGALAGFVAVESRSPAPMLPLGLFRSRLFSGTNLLTLFLYGALGGALFFLPFNLMQIQHYSATEAGASLLPFSALLFLLSRWSGSVADRVGVRLPLVVGPSLAALGFALLARPGIGGSYWSTFFPAIAVLGLGMAITVPPLTTAVLGAVGEEHTGTASGVNNAVSRVAGLLAIAALGLVMVTVFSATLDRRLARLDAPASVARALQANATHLAAIEIPADLDPQLALALRAEIGRAFVAGFRAVMLICAALALSGGLVALVTIPPAAHEPSLSAEAGRR